MSTRTRIRQLQNRNHKAWPLGTHVVVRFPSQYHGGEFEYMVGTVHRHEKGRTASCHVDFSPARIAGCNTVGVGPAFASRNHIDQDRRHVHPIYYRNMRKMPEGLFEHRHFPDLFTRASMGNNYSVAKRA